MEQIKEEFGSFDGDCLPACWVGQFVHATNSVDQIGSSRSWPDQVSEFSYYWSVSPILIIW